MSSRITKPVIFISHIHEEAPLAALLSSVLGDSFSLGIEFFVSSDKSIKPGTDWYKAVMDNIDNSSMVLVLCSKSSISRPWVNFETGAALMADKPVVPLCHSTLQLSDMQPPLSLQQGYNLSKDTQLKKFINQLEDKFGLKAHIDIPEIRNKITEKEEIIRKQFEEAEQQCASVVEAQLHALEEDFFRFAELAKKTVCYHQGEYAQFQFLASELHKTLRLMNDQEALCALDDYFNARIEHAAKKSFFFLHEYYQSRHSILPRICLKGTETRGSDKYVVTVFRDDEVPYSSDVPIKKNSAFDHIDRSGRFYRVNNIPQQVVDGTYVNGRIDVDKTEAYLNKQTRDTTALDKGGGTKDSEWTKCWRIVDSYGNLIPDIDPRSCYKSTLVIPLTLWRNKLDIVFIEQINNKIHQSTESSEVENIDRLIFGYLCIDHVTEGYFNSGTDLNIAYIVADLLSLYLLVKMIYTESSSTYRSIKHSE
jgi:hypothetical protein